MQRMAFRSWGPFCMSYAYTVWPVSFCNVLLLFLIWMREEVAEDRFMERVVRFFQSWLWCLEEFEYESESNFERYIEVQ